MSLFYSSILNKFPQKYIKFAFAYGSGVFKQLQNTDSSKNMIDFVFVVDDSIRFHEENIRMNPSHYSFLKWLGPYYITKIQNNYGAACYYNTLIPIKIDNEPLRLIKYGVVTEESIIRDLYDWDYLYMSGRLHKPVRIIKRAVNKEKSTDENHDELLSVPVNKSIDLALQTNLQNALHTALLLLPEKFNLMDLFVCITALSYTGDFRMLIGENKNKCYNIVEPQLERFLDLYKPYLIKEAVENFLSCNFETGQLRQPLNQPTIYHHLNLLPRNLIQTMINIKFKTTHFYDLEEYIYKLTNRIDYKEVVRESVSSIVRRTSLVQSLKGVLTAGVVKSTDYSLRKIKKMF